MWLYVNYVFIVSFLKLLISCCYSYYVVGFIIQFDGFDSDGIGWVMFGLLYVLFLKFL